MAVLVAAEAVQVQLLLVLVALEYFIFSTRRHNDSFNL
jgi:hypothetical protein